MADRRAFLLGSEVFVNRFVWSALAVSSVILLVTRVWEPLREILQVGAMLNADWLIVGVAAFSSLIINRLLKESGLTL